MKLGVCYYPEQWPAERWSVDAQAMRAAGLSIARIGEFAWARIEPGEGRFEWDWLDQAMETLSTAGLEVVLGTPTAAPPAWLCRQEPEILPVDAQGRRRRFGSRRHYCANSPAYRSHTTRIVTALAQRYGQHPALAAWQVDNELGDHDTARCYCDACAQEFRRWLQEKYGSLEALNQAWGTSFWSQVYGDWDEIQPPILTVTQPNPSQVLDYYRFSSDSLAEYLELQVGLLREHSPGKLVTTNFMGSFPDLDSHRLARPLDFAAWDSYPTGSAEVQSGRLYRPGDPRPAVAYDAGDPYMTAFGHDLTRSLKQAPFWVMEQQAGHINWSAANTGVRAGNVRLWTWHALASGASAVLYFRWRAALAGQEQYHSGLLQHDGSPGVGWADVRRLAGEGEAMKKIEAAPRQAEVAILLSYEDLWALQLQPHRSEFEYLRHLFVYYRALKQLGMEVDFVAADSDLKSYRLLIAPTLHLVDRTLVEHMEWFARRGGTLLLGVRSGFKTPSNQVTDLPLPGLLRSLVGATITGWHALPNGIGYPLETSIPGLKGPAEFWAEAIRPPLEARLAGPGEAQVFRSLATYSEGPFEGQAALSEHAFGRGRVFYAGWYPSLAQAQALLAYIAASDGLAVLTGLPEGVLAARREGCLLLMNFADTQAEYRLNGQAVRIPPRDVVILEQDSVTIPQFVQSKAEE